MEFLAHRGLWKKKKEKNSVRALCSALENGFGLETDVRDRMGELVISHDPPSAASPSLRDFLDKAEVHSAYGRAIIAFNIKADGLHNQLQEMVNEYKIRENSFFFDMSFPTLYQFSRAFPRQNLCSRVSAFEPRPVLHKKCGWIWVDCFGKDWQDIRKAERFGKNTVFVSPELHGRKPEHFWRRLKMAPVVPKKRVFLCTDLPIHARKVFGL